MSAPTDSARTLTGFTPHLTHAAKLRLVRTQARITWQDSFDLLWSYGRPAPLDMRHAVAERLDVMSGPYEHTMPRVGAARILASGLNSVPGLLRAVLGPRRRDHPLWHLLFVRATPDGRRRLVRSFGDTLADDLIAPYGPVWTRALWPLIPPLYPPGRGPVDGITAIGLLALLATGVHQADDTALPGEIFTEALVALAAYADPQTLAEALSTPTASRSALSRAAPWFLAKAHRLSDAAVVRLLDDSSPVLRSWTLTHVLPVRGATAGVAHAASSPPVVRRARRRP